MNFPMENPLFRFFYWVINTPGVGGLAVLVIVGGLSTVALLTLRWIALGSAEDEDVYSFPTATLLEHEESEQPSPF
jgi:hypothetical protein